MTTDKNGIVYHGVVGRQALIDLCQGELPRLRKETENYAESVDLFERQHGDHTATIQAFNNGIAENIGFQKALRMVCEWAKDNLIEPDPIPDHEDEVADMKKQLKEKFGA
jgi:hypothetical protein